MFGDGHVDFVMMRDMPGSFEFLVPGPAGLERWALAVHVEGTHDSAWFGTVNTSPFEIVSTVQAPPFEPGFNVELPPELRAALLAAACSGEGFTGDVVATELAPGFFEFRFAGGAVATAFRPGVFGKAYKFGTYRFDYIYGETENGEVILWIIMYVQRADGSWERLWILKLNWTWPAPPPSPPTGGPITCAELVVSIEGAIAEMDALLMERWGPAARELLDGVWQEFWQQFWAQIDRYPELQCAPVMPG